MINKQTILSVADDQLTLYEWLTYVQDALENASLETATINDEGDGKVSFSFVFGDGSKVDTGTLTIPTPKDGKDGVGVSSIAVSDAGELVVTLTDGSSVNAGSTLGKAGTITKNGDTYEITFSKVNLPNSDALLFADSNKTLGDAMAEIADDVDAKQDKLSDAQLAACNSGIDKSVLNNLWSTVDSKISQDDEDITFAYPITFGQYLSIYDDDRAYEGTDNFGGNDIDANYYSTGITAHDGDNLIDYNLSFPKASGTFALREDSAPNVIYIDLSEYYDETDKNYKVYLDTLIGDKINCIIKFDGKTHVSSGYEGLLWIYGNLYYSIDFHYKTTLSVDFFTSKYDNEQGYIGIATSETEGYIAIINGAVLVNFYDCTWER